MFSFVWKESQLIDLINAIDDDIDKSNDAITDIFLFLLSMVLDEISTFIIYIYEYL